MKAVSPVIPGANFEELIVAENQPEYENLPTIQLEGGIVLTRWKLTAEEIKIVAETGDIYLFMWGRPVKPLMLQAEMPQLEVRLLEEASPATKVDSITCVRFTEERLEKAAAGGLKVSKDKCAVCEAVVLISDGSRLEMEKRLGVLITCLECHEQIKAAGPVRELILPETQKEAEQVEEALRNKF